MTSVLDGLRVIECGEGASAAYAAKLLADYGADVTKVEAPNGDRARRRGPFPDHEAHPEKSGAFLYLNTNKRGVILDLRRPGGREALARLAEAADLLIHNVPPAEMDGFGLSFERLHQRNPALVMTSISPFGASGPYRDWKADEITSANAGGWAWLIDPDAGSPDLPPLKAFGLQCQYHGGLNAAVASLGALIARDLQGAGGQQIDVSVQECVMAFLEMNFIHYTYGGRIASRMGQRLLQPWAIVQAKDGLVFLLCVEEDQWQRFVEWMGRPEWAGWDVFADRFLRAGAWDVLKPLIEEWTRQHTVEEIYQGGLQRRLAFAPVATMADLLANEHLRVRDFFVRCVHPEAGTIELPGAPTKIGQEPYTLRRPAPRLGQHTEEVLAEAGLSNDEIARLRADGVTVADAAAVS
jgi:crotonobetainyl-CoA:carnitine CoA-transferase CaiB-like acyl-CoA transferase